MICLFSCYRLDQQGFKEVHAFTQIPRHKDLIRVAEGELFKVDMTGIDAVLEGFDKRENKEDRLIGWRQGQHYCQLFMIDLHDNGPKPSEI